jgi:hypothetical protein
MTIKQKLTSFVNNNLMKIFFRLPADYDFQFDLIIKNIKNIKMGIKYI